MLRKRVDRDRLAIKHWLERHGHSFSSVARAEGVSPALVQSTADGWQNNRRVLAAFARLGMPESLLALPGAARAVAKDEEAA